MLRTQSTFTHPFCKCDRSKASRLRGRIQNAVKSESKFETEQDKRYKSSACQNLFGGRGASAMHSGYYQTLETLSSAHHKFSPSPPFVNPQSGTLRYLAIRGTC